MRLQRKKKKEVKKLLGENALEKITLNKKFICKKYHVYEVFNGFIRTVHPGNIVEVEKTGKEYKVNFAKTSPSLTLQNIKIVVFTKSTTLNNIREHYSPVKLYGTLY